jgi:hypothetical protein
VECRAGFSLPVCCLLVRLRSSACVGLLPLGSPSVLGGWSNGEVGRGWDELPGLLMRLDLVFTAHLGVSLPASLAYLQ